MTVVYAWLTGEQTNVGDSLLRRPYIEFLSRIGPVQAWVRHSSPDFLANAGIHRVRHAEPSFARWYGRLVLSALRQRTVLALNAGQAPSTPTAPIAAAALTLAAGLVRLRGGYSLWLGGTVPATAKRAERAAYSLLARRVTVVRWREPGASALTGRLAPVSPDWGFSLGAATEHWDGRNRDVAAFVLRGDRAYPTRRWLDWAKASLAELGLRAVVVVQVRQDRERADRLATDLGGEVLPWDEADGHAEQEARVRALYRRARITIGDRLHGLILAATEGSVPIGWVETSTGKIRAHFDAVGLEYVGAHEGPESPSLPELQPAFLDALARDLPGDVDRIRASMPDRSILPS